MEYELGGWALVVNEAKPRDNSGGERSGGYSGGGVGRFGSGGGGRRGGRGGRDNGGGCGYSKPRFSGTLIC